ncbi:MAG TPA: DNA-processing protein DprA [Candidatus Tumulicola sp.]|jgi:DNA processing protein
MECPVFERREQIESRRAGRPLDAAGPGLWCAGTLAGLARPCVAIVGTRAATLAGKRLAHQLAADLGRAGCCIVSGLALGIDASAHEGALAANAPTIGVLGSGHQQFFPRRNRGLAQRMIEAGGAVLSPYAPDRAARPWQFLARNGTVASLADAVVVVEAPARSGALNTASWAAGRIPVLAVPGDVDRPHVAGCLALIRDGATLARGAADVLEAIGALPLPFEAPPRAASATPYAGALLDALDAGARRLDELIATTGIEPATALAALTVLELEDVIASGPGATYGRVRPSAGVGRGGAVLNVSC